MTRGASLLDESFERRLGGWDFDWLGDRLRQDSYSWCYEDYVASFQVRAATLLDLGTGGGEWLATRVTSPTRTVATESWVPNVAIAGARLRPLGVSVVAVEASPDNVDQGRDAVVTLPFLSETFDLVVARHESFVADEVHRVLRAGGHFVTEQVGDGRYNEFRALLGEEPSDRVRLSRELLVTQLDGAGLRVSDALEEERLVHVADAGALAWYLRMVPWIVPEFTRERHGERLRAIQSLIDREGALAVPLRGMFVVVTKD